MNKILLFGADGQLGSDIKKVFKNNYLVIPVVHKDIDITNYQEVNKIIRSSNPKYIINCTAYHKVDEIEENFKKAFTVNAFAQQNIAKIATEIDACAVFISTDYVFGQNLKKRNEYIETDTTGPINLYGVSKVAGEELTRLSAKKYFIIRTSGLFGINQSSEKGDNFIERMIKFSQQKESVNVVNDQILSPTYTVDIAQNLLLLLKTKKYGLYHMVSQGHCSWWEFTKEIYRLLNIHTKLAPVNSDFFQTEAKRPKFSALSNYNLENLGLNKMKSWRVNLKNYLKEKGHLN